MAYSTVILCGGQGHRMGQDKKYIDWHGMPLITHMANGFPDCRDLIISLRAPEALELPRPVRFVYDSIDDAGPLAGLSAALAAMEEDVLFVTACDTPLVDQNTADVLLAYSGDHDAVVPVSEDGKIHPLTALYRRSALAPAETLLAAGRRKMLALLDELDVLYLSGTALPHGERTLANLNTPADLAALLEAIP